MNVIGREVAVVLSDGRRRLVTDAILAVDVTEKRERRGVLTDGTTGGQPPRRLVPGALAATERGFAARFYDFGRLIGGTTPLARYAVTSLP
jgi:hypothetical protein